MDIFLLLKYLIVEKRVSSHYQAFDIIFFKLKYKILKMKYRFTFPYKKERRKKEVLIREFIELNLLITNKGSIFGLLVR